MKSTIKLRAQRPLVLAALIAGSTLAPAVYAATLQPGDFLTITGPTLNGYGYVTAGSWFSMGGSTAPPKRTGLSQGTQGLIIGSPQAPGGLCTGTGTGTCSYSGAPTAGDTSNINAPWTFYGNTGKNFTTTAVTGGTTSGLTMSGWAVTWNGVGGIAMGNGAWTPTTSYGTTESYSNGVANFTWDGTYGDSYTLDYAATVPSGSASGFGGVEYYLHLTGKVVSASSLPVANNGTAITTYTTSAGTAPQVAVDVSNDVTSATALSSVAVSGTPVGGTTAVSGTTITFTPAACTSPTSLSTPYGTVQGCADSFQYTATNALGTSAAPGTITVYVEQNVAPTAVNDSGGSVSAGSAIPINVLSNDTDVNNNIAPGTVAIVNQPSLGTAVVNSTTGTITYTANVGASGSDSFTYTVADADGAVSNAATVTVNIQAVSAGAYCPTGDICTMDFTAGSGSGSSTTGSYFTMQMSPTQTLYTILKPGPDGGITLNTDQPASGSHSGAANGSETAGIDQAWNFFGNTGLSYTKNGGITINTATSGNGPAGTLDFGNRWFVTWNGIPAINMGGCSGSTCPSGVTDLGYASLSCSTSTGQCTDGANFSLTYNAHVPVGDPSGFGGVPYGLHMTGIYKIYSAAPQAPAGATIAPGPIATSAGLTTERMTTAQLTTAGVPADTAAAESCVGGCFDFTLTGLTGATANVVLPLSAGVPTNAIYRKYSGGKWQDLPSADQIQSAAYTAGSGGACPAPGTTGANGYHALTTGDQCLELTLPVSGGTVSDPGGLAVLSSSITPQRAPAASGSSGCSINPDPVAPGNGGAWLIVGGFIAWLGIGKHRRSKRSNRSAR